MRYTRRKFLFKVNRKVRGKKTTANVQNVLSGTKRAIWYLVEERKGIAKSVIRFYLEIVT